MSHLHSLVYVSRLSPGLGETDIAHILQSARRHNARNQITGFLAFTGDNFLQVLEGPPLTVTQTLGYILQDRRHVDSELLSFQPIHGRRFPSWSMGYAAVATLHEPLIRRYCGDATLSAATITAEGALDLLVALSRQDAAMGHAEPAPDRARAGLTVAAC